MKTLLITACCVASLGGCAMFADPARDHELKIAQGAWIDFDASRRGMMVLPAETNAKVCAEPSPDVALSMVAKIKASVKDGKGSEAVAAEAEFNTAVVKLAERTQMVMFLRESMYRLCEQSMNNDFKQEDVIAMYTKVLDAARSMAAADVAQAQEKAEQAKQKTLKFQAEQLRNAN